MIWRQWVSDMQTVKQVERDDGSAVSVMKAQLCLTWAIITPLSRALFRLKTLPLSCLQIHERLVRYIYIRSLIRRFCSSAGRKILNELALSTELDLLKCQGEEVFLERVRHVPLKVPWFFSAPSWWPITIRGRGRRDSDESARPRAICYRLDVFTGTPFESAHNTHEAGRTCLQTHVAHYGTISPRADQDQGWICLGDGGAVVPVFIPLTRPRISSF